MERFWILVPLATHASHLPAPHVHVRIYMHIHACPLFRERRATTPGAVVSRAQGGGPSFRVAVRAGRTWERQPESLETPGGC